MEIKSCYETLNELIIEALINRITPELLHAAE